MGSRLNAMRFLKKIKNEQKGQRKFLSSLRLCSSMAFLFNFMFVIN